LAAFILFSNGDAALGQDCPNYITPCFGETRRSKRSSFSLSKDSRRVSQYSPHIATGQWPITTKMQTLLRQLCLVLLPNCQRTVSLNRKAPAGPPDLNKSSPEPRLRFFPC